MTITPFMDPLKANCILRRLANHKVYLFEYDKQSDCFTIQLSSLQSFPHFLDTLETNTKIHTEDRWKVKEFCLSHLRGPVTIQVYHHDILTYITLDGELCQDCKRPTLLGTLSVVQEQKQREKLLEEQVKRDQLTHLYNHYFGQEIIKDYLEHKDPLTSCGFIILDIDSFKSVNDFYGHLFGDEVLCSLADLLKLVFDKKDILCRIGGDEFVVFVKNISNRILAKKASQLLEAIHECQFSRKDYRLTCSIGICFLPENTTGYTYEQLFQNADWALYKAKENGKDRYEFCDSLQRFESVSRKVPQTLKNTIDERYLRNDVLSTAFELFEKMNSFSSAMTTLLEVIGIRFALDRITVISADVKNKVIKQSYQWTSENIPASLEVESPFEEEDFLTLFKSYDEMGSTVLQYDNMHMFTESGQALLMQGNAKTILCTAMYCEGKYVGAISYVVCDQKRYWTKQDRFQLSEITKVISAHLAKSQALNSRFGGIHSSPEYDPLTGLLSFTHFKEETERLILSGDGKNHAMIYTDFDNFKYFNQRYGYQAGDHLLKDFSHFIIPILENESHTFFTRVIADQFITFSPYEKIEDLVQFVQEQNNLFIQSQEEKYPGLSLQIHSGIYPIQEGDVSASAAIDAANYARYQTKQDASSSVMLYDETLEFRRKQENDIIHNMTSALVNHEFKVYYQPRCSLLDRSIVAAEALVRWERPDGSILYPDTFIPLYERNGRIMELDMYVFENVVRFQAENIKKGNKLIPISVNVSSLHAINSTLVEHFDSILKNYHVDASLIEIELTETADILKEEYEQLKKMFEHFQEKHFKTAIDDFGAGHSVLSMLLDIPVNIIKLDHRFVQYCESMDRGINFLKQLIQMVQKMGYHLVCEGIETQEQMEILRDMGCIEGQGYWLSPPLSQKDFEKWIY